MNLKQKYLDLADRIQKLHNTEFSLRLGSLFGAFFIGITAFLAYNAAFRQGAVSEERPPEILMLEPAGEAIDEIIEESERANIIWEERSAETVTWEIDIGPRGIDPSGIIINVGDVVRFYNDTGVEVLITSDALILDGARVPNRSTYSVKIERQGIYLYETSAGHTGRITVR